MEDEINSLNAKLRKLDIIQTNIKRTFFLGAGVILIAFIIATLIALIICIPYFAIKLGTIIDSFLLTLPACFFLCVVFGVPLADEYLQNKKTKKGLENQLDFLNNDIEKQKDLLEELKKKKINSNELKNGFHLVRVNDKNILAELRNYLNLYYDCGYNNKKYYKYYKKGKLKNKLSKYYNESEIVMIEDYFKENEQSFTKKRTLKR